MQQTGLLLRPKSSNVNSVGELARFVESNSSLLEDKRGHELQTSPSLLRLFFPGSTERGDLEHLFVKFLK